MDKVNRNYQLFVQDEFGASVTIKNPFSVEFDIKRNILSSANVSSLRLINLSDITRNFLRKDAYDYGLVKPILFKAGYGSNLSVCFAGNISAAWSVREGTEFITEIHSYDGGNAYSNGIVNMQFPAGASQQTVVQNLVDSLGNFNVTPGVIGQIDGTLSRTNSYSGSTTDILDNLTGGGFFIDNGKANVLADNEFIAGEIAIINAKSGLLGTPVRENLYLNLEVLFEPRLVIGQQIQLQSQTGTNFSGNYKILSLHHRGIISESVGGRAVTSVGLWAPKAMTGVQ